MTGSTELMIELRRQSLRVYSPIDCPVEWEEATRACNPSKCTTTLDIERRTKDTDFSGRKSERNESVVGIGSNDDTALILKLLARIRTLCFLFNNRIQVCFPMGSA